MRTARSRLDRLRDEWFAKAAPRVIPRKRYDIHTSQIGARNPSPASAGEGGPKGRMGCGPRLRPEADCTNVTVHLRSKRTAPHTPSVAFGDTPGSLLGGRLFPASRRRGARCPPAGSMALCECDSPKAGIRLRGHDIDRNHGSHFGRRSRPTPLLTNCRVKAFL